MFSDPYARCYCVHRTLWSIRFDYGFEGLERFSLCNSNSFRVSLTNVDVIYIVIYQMYYRFGRSASIASNYIQIINYILFAMIVCELEIFQYISVNTTARSGNQFIVID